MSCTDSRDRGMTQRSSIFRRRIHCGVTLWALWGVGGHGCVSAGGQPDAERRAETTDVAITMSVATLVGHPNAYVGRLVSVSGRCLGWTGPALGSPPLTRSDWQLEDRGEAVWVSARLPQDCAGPGGGLRPVVRFTGRVLLDTVPHPLRSAEPTPRPYLVQPR